MLDSNTYNTVKGDLIPKLKFATNLFDFSVPTQHSGQRFDYARPATVWALDITGSDIFFEKMPKK